MIEYILAASVRRRWLVLLVALAAALSGAWSLTKLPIDAVPDVTNVQVQINALAPELSPVERQEHPHQIQGGAERGLRRRPARRRGGLAQDLRH
jgi:hypothetical protein